MSIQHDSLVHVLLCELLAGETTPDLAPRILLAARAYRRRRMLRIAPYAAAAVLVAAIGGWFLVPPAYPAPRIVGAHVVEGSGPLDRGAAVALADEPARLSLGGYCRIDMEPRTTFRIRGEKHAEEIFLRSGAITCDIDRNIGAFSVGTEFGTVSVTGTTFTVRLIERKGGTEMGTTGGKTALALAVAVLAGSVSVSFEGESVALSTGTSCVFADEAIKSQDPPAERSKDDRIIISRGVVVGTVVEMGMQWLKVKSVSGKGVIYREHWENGKKVTKGLDGVKLRDTVVLEWAVNDHPRVISVRKLEEGEKPAQRGIPDSVRGFSGMVRGVVVEKGRKHTFMFEVGKVLKVWKNNKAKTPKGLEGLTVSVGPRWVKGENGKWHPVERHVAFIRRLEEKQELNLEIVNVEKDHFAILELSGEQREWAAGGGEGGEKEREEGDAAQGSVRGIVTRINKKYIEVKAEGDEEPRRYHLGEPLQNVYATNLVELVWKKGEGRRVVSVEPVVPSKKEGTVTGTIVAKGETFIDVKPADGPTERYIPRWIGGMPKDGGGLEKDMLRTLSKLKVGARVKVTWIYEERKRVIAVDD